MAMDVLYDFIEEGSFPPSALIVENIEGLFVQDIEVGSCWKVEAIPKLPVAITDDTEETEDEIENKKEIKPDKSKWFGGRNLWRALLPVVDPTVILITQESIKDDLADQLRRAILEVCIEKGTSVCVGPQVLKQALTFIDTANVALHPSNPTWPSIAKLLSFFFKADIQIDGEIEEEKKSKGKGKSIATAGTTIERTIYLRCTQRRQWYSKIELD